MHHHLFQLTFGGKIYNAPIDEQGARRVLDVGTGTGIWAIDFGTPPRSKFVGCTDAI